MGSADLPVAWAALTQRARELTPGLATVLTVAAAANFVAIASGGPVMLLALLIGMTLNFLTASPPAQPGLSFAAKPVLQIGVALLGLRISLDDIVSLGLETALLVIAGVGIAILSGVTVARLWRQGTAFGLLAGGATAICGASAALAIAAVLPRSAKSERQTAFVVVAVTTYSTVAMVLYPVLARALGFDDHTTGILLGATIHDVAQVVGAGYAVSPEAGDTATIVKLLRVALLLPMVFVIALAIPRARRDATPGAAPLPLFAVAFGAMVAVNSLRLLPQPVSAGLIEISHWCLLVAVASIGVRTSVQEMLKMGSEAMGVPAAATLALLTFVAVFLAVF